MDSWSFRAFQQENRTKPVAVVAAGTHHGKAIQSISKKLPVIFTLKHLALMSGTSYKELRSFVDRSANAPYRSFTLRKRRSGNGIRSFRVIKVPVYPLKKVQQYISSNILSKMLPHQCSVAFAPGCKIYNAALEHCNARWLFKFDIVNFFDSITEKEVYRVFRRHNYPPLLSFEMARICTALKSQPPRNWGGTHAHQRYPNIPGYSNTWLGTLPQGAPTSPMLANLTSLKLDTCLEAIAESYNCQYSRYADDITFSTNFDISRDEIPELIGKVNRTLRKFGHFMNKSKTTIAPPGARKFYLGLNVHEKEPQLRKNFKRKIRQHLFFCEKSSVGPEKHAAHLKFASVIGFRNHLEGLITHASQIDKVFGEECKNRFDAITWPL